jgi:hypothetical protein
MSDIEVKGIEALNRKMLGIQQRLDTGDPGSTINRVMKRAVLRVQAGMMVYPSQRAGSSYRRTGTLGRRWTNEVVPSGNTLIGKVGNNTEYGPFVQSEAFQASTHQGVWQTDRGVIELERPTIVSEFAQLVQGVVQGSYT